MEPLHLSVVAIEKGPFGSHTTTFGNFTYLPYIYISMICMCVCVHARTHARLWE